jgi:hypothetical protein
VTAGNVITVGNIRASSGILTIAGEVAIFAGPEIALLLVDPVVCVV